MVHLKNTGRVIVRTSADNFTAFLKDILRFDPGQTDDLGILQRCQMDSHKYAKDLKSKNVVDKNCKQPIRVIVRHIDTNVGSYSENHHHN